MEQWGTEKREKKKRRKKTRVLYSDCRSTRIQESDSESWNLEREVDHGISNRSGMWSVGSPGRSVGIGFDGIRRDLMRARDYVTALLFGLWLAVSLMSSQSVGALILLLAWVLTDPDPYDETGKG